MTILPMRLVLLAWLLLAGTATASDVYKWKDADGGLHFTDTPPPPGATLISGPKITRPAASAPSQPDCRTDISAKDCARARVALERDAESLKAEMPPEDPAASDAHARRADELRRQDCEQLQQAKTAIEKRLNGESSEILTDEERAAQPEQLADIERRLRENCR